MFKELYQAPQKKTFLRDNNKSYTYQWLQESIKKTVGLFQALQLKQGDRLLLAVSDDREMSVLFLSALATGIVVVIADPEMKAPRAALRAGNEAAVTGGSPDNSIVMNRKGVAPGTLPRIR